MALSTIQKKQRPQTKQKQTPPKQQQQTTKTNELENQYQ